MKIEDEKKQGKQKWEVFTEECAFISIEELWTPQKADLQATRAEIQSIETLRSKREIQNDFSNIPELWNKVQCDVTYPET